MPLPRDILVKRVRNELNLCMRKVRHIIEIPDPTLSRFPIEVEVTLVQTPGPIWLGDRVSHIYTHKFKMFITENYPYEKPVVRWLTEIFHPNIMPPEEGGYVCTKLLDTWSFTSNILTFVKGIESLLVTPNPSNPYGSDTCTRAAEYFNRSSYKPPTIAYEKPKEPRILE